MLANMPPPVTNPLTHAETGATMIPDRTTVLMMGVRKLLIDGLGFVEDWLGMPHSIMSADERRLFRKWQERQARGE